ncbi:MAG TPA: hypothetical protein VG652_07960 [Gaiellaceae bacterium]|nr:hypothetical protein [Gaiellaceae bacterium]
MPVEGQWDRINHPLRSTDRRALGIMGVVTLLAIIVAVVFVVTKPAHSDAGCVIFNVPASVGGATVRYCGDRAKTFCAAKDVQPAAAAAACRREGYLS